MAVPSLARRGLEGLTLLGTLGVLYLGARLVGFVSTAGARALYRRIHALGGRFLYGLDQLVLGIALQEGDAVAGAFGLDFQGVIDLRQGLRAVDSRLALPQQIQIRTVQHQKIRHSTLPKRTLSFANLRGFV